MKTAGTKAAFEEAYKYATRKRKVKERDLERNVKFENIDLVDNMNQMFRLISKF